MSLKRTTPILRSLTTDLDAFHVEITGKQYKHARPGIEDMPWDTRDMTIRDPFGNRLVFTSAISA